jgi:DNA polymerase delta subunit 1
MPATSKKRRMLILDKNGKRRPDVPAEEEEEEKKHAPKKQKVGDTRQQRLAKLSQVPKSSFEGDLERLTQEINELKEGDSHTHSLLEYITDT